MSKKYTPTEVAIKVLQKTEELLKSSMGSLKVTAVTPVQGVVSPTQSNTASTVVKSPKAKKMGQAGDKPSVFFKSEDFKDIKKASIENLRAFLEHNRGKK
jgi:hypothetical protein